MSCSDITINFLPSSSQCPHSCHQSHAGGEINDRFQIALFYIHADCRKSNKHKSK